MNHIEEGRFFLETVWLRVAIEVVETAIQVYKLEGEEAEALRKVFGQPRLYTVALS
jgi:CDP-diacylglycerol pyrophosphatase